METTPKSPKQAVLQEYFKLPPTRVYKEKNPTCSRRKPSYRNLHSYGLETRIDQENVEIPLVWSNDKMTITTPNEINNIDVNKTYSQDWVAYNQAQTQEKMLFLELLKELTDLIPTQKYKGTGRPPSSLGEMVYSICIKLYLGFSSRRTESDIRIVEQLGYISHVPHFNTILKYLNKPELNEIFKALIDLSASPLRHVEQRFAVDSSGFCTSIFSRYSSIRYKKEERRYYKKAHITCGVLTNVITSVEVTDGYMHDSLMFRSLVDHTAQYFDMKEVYADKAYSSRKNLGIVHDHKAIPFIPFKSNTRRLTKGVPIWSTMYNYFKYNKEQFMEHYHQRSNVETVFSMIKRKQSLYLHTKKDISQTNEILAKCLVHNICVLIQEMFELGIKVDYNECDIDEFMCKIKI